MPTRSHSTRFSWPAQIPAAVLAAVLVARHAKLTASDAAQTFRAAWAQQRHKLVGIGVLLLLSTVNYGLFVWSTRLVEPALSVMLYETWPIAMALTMARKSGPASRRLGRSAAVPLCLAVAGISVVIVSQAEGALFDTTSRWAAGVGLGFAAGALGGVFPAASLMVGWVAVRSGGGRYRDPQPQVVFWGCASHAAGSRGLVLL